MAEKRARVLVVDDDDDFRAILEQMLERDYDVVSLADGGGLIDEVSSSKPDLVILDVMLPGPDGFQLCRLMRESPAGRRLPVLFLTARDGDSDFVENLESGGSAYLTKPVTRQDLLAKVGELLSDSYGANGDE